MDCGDDRVDFHGFKWGQFVCQWSDATLNFKRIGHDSRVLCRRRKAVAFVSGTSCEFYIHLVRKLGGLIVLVEVYCHAGLRWL